MRSRYRLLAALPVCCIALSACGGQPAVDPAQQAESREVQPEAALTVVSAEPTLKYPKASWVVELTLGNPSSAPVWFLIPEPPEFSPGIEREAWAAEAVRLGGHPAATMVRISATHGLAAFRLAPEARLTVRGLSLDSWHPEPVPSVEIWAVSEILLDGRPLMGGWLGDVDPTLSGTIDTDGATEESLYEWVDPDLASHSLTYTPQTRWSLETGQDEGNWPWRPRE